MTRREFPLPDIGEGLLDAEIVTWLVADGDIVSEFDPLVVVQTDKADTEISSPFSGTVVECKGSPGDRIAVGSTIAVFETSGEPSPGDSQTPPEADGDVSHVSGIPSSRDVTDVKVQASPSIRRYARERNVDLASVAGTGRHGRIGRTDVDSHAEGTATNAMTASPATAEVPVAAQKVGTAQLLGERIPYVGIRRAVAETVERSARTIPHVYDWREADATGLLALRDKLRRNNPDRAQYVTLVPILAKLTAVALRRFPDLNASLDEAAGEIVRHRAVHLGIATATDHGLLVPVLTNVHSRSILDVALAAAELVDRARRRTASREELVGGTITINNLGAVGGHYGSPLIRPPESAIVAFGRIRESVVAIDGKPAVRPVLPLSIGADHRLVDGDQLCGFGATLASFVTSPSLAIGDML